MSKTNFSNIINSEKPVLIDFHAEWCGPCKMMAPILSDLKSKVGDTAKIIKIDIDKNRDLATKFQVRGVPTLMIFKEGELKWRNSGIHSVAQLDELIKSYAS